MTHSSPPVLAEVWRGPYLEALHHGSVVVTAPDGTTRLTLGCVDAPTLPRSALKPLQAVAMLREGLDVDGAELALVGASHSGEDFHVAAVASILAGAGLTADALQTTPGLPFGRDAATDWIRSGRGPEPISHNCSGKHAGMLRTCVRAGWPLKNYRDASHPLQLATRSVLSELTGDEVGEPVIDGCGAPAFAVTLTGLARAFGRLAASPRGDLKTVADAFRRFPEYASGSGRDEVFFHREVAGLVCKLGAEGAFAVGLPDGTGIALKVTDGSQRGIAQALVAVLQRLGLGSPSMASFDPNPVLGHGAVVGRVSASATLLEALNDLPD